MATIEEMADELEKAGYTVSVIEYGDNTIYLYPFVSTPEHEWEWQGQEEKLVWNKWAEIEQRLLEQAIHKAYVHLQVTKRLAALESFVKRIRDYPAEIEPIQDNESFLMDMITEAMQLIPSNNDNEEIPF